MHDRPNIGVVGTGKMGLPMTRNLLAAGYNVSVHNRSAGSVAEAVSAGAIDAGSCAGVTATADIVVTSLTNQQSVRDVYLGDAGLAAHARDGQIFIDTSTNDPQLVKDIAAALDAKGAGFLDSPVSGGVTGAVNGTLTVMVGGDASTFERALPVLEAIGQSVHLLGPVGAGTAVKLVNQLLVGVNMAAVAEGLVLGVKAGADPRKILDVISTSFGGSKMLDRGVPLIMDRNFAPATPVDLIRKDLGIIAALADELDVPLSVTTTALAEFDKAADAGFGDNDMTAIVLPLEAKAGIEVV